ncbi:4-amino-4-deoxy-L-arabinose transferase-like glycosyltransferase [Sphingobium sp. B1D7B]|uniref:hypothetical protein n=1 Tax=Sphingobium sp. B1D7B TaxID=2940578 RepID=UPI002225A96A|nr:hypothetical protein [Sphingobium sp. B1D7B]MCW2404187.1 4-amino-4-deoxy-L-arabinose transferase-like glycosyltransferase [Sphingobium sp. B1D7B]
MKQGSSGAGRLWLAATPVLVIFAIAAFLFARVQNIWIDETTQLSGVTLAPGALLSWLAGGYDAGFGVPDDRMPPLSYFIDMIGWHLWGANELAFRLYHAAITAGGILILMRALASRYGSRAALIAGLLLVLSPRLVSMAVEIRAYPILLAISCGQAAMVIRGDVAQSVRRLGLFVLLGVLSGYTHFFGLVATSAYTLAIFIDARTVRGAVRVVLAYALLLLLWAGLAPFVLGAANLSSPAPGSAAPAGGVGLGDIAAFLAQMLVSGATLVDLPVAALCFAGGAILLLIAAVGLGGQAATRGTAIRHDPVIGLILALAAGTIVTIAAALLVSQFDALAPRYNIWMLAPLAVILALAADGAIARRGRVADWVRHAGTALLVIGSAAALVMFLVRADWFIHGPSRTLESMVAKAEKPLAVLHVGDAWAWAYFPLYRTHRDDLPQWLLTADGRSAIRITRGGDPGGPPQPLTALADRATLLVSHVELKSHNDLRAVARGETPPPARDLVPALTAAGWRPAETIDRPGNFAFTGTLYHHPDPASAPTRQPAAPAIEDLSE